jgi:hypothetical protein
MSRLQKTLPSKSCVNDEVRYSTRPCLYTCLLC